jgi:phosphoglucosamine mutase
MVRYPQILINVKDVSKDKLANNEKVKKAINDATMELGDKGRILLRASGTEPVIRVMVEAERSELAERFATTLAALVKSELSL